MRSVKWVVKKTKISIVGSTLDYQQSLFFLIVRRERSEKIKTRLSLGEAPLLAKRETVLRPGIVCYLLTNRNPSTSFNIIGQFFFFFQVYLSLSLLATLSINHRTQSPMEQEVKYSAVSLATDICCSPWVKCPSS